MALSMTQVFPPCCEHDLVSAARHGDSRGFEALYSRYRERINAFIVSRVHDHERAEDIGQEVFISALRRLRASDQTITFKPWIYEIAKNACIDEFRRASRRREVSLDADEGLASGRRGLLSVAPTPPAAVESKQRLDDLQGAFGGLSSSHRKLLVMREFEGLSYEEIGARTDASRQVVESTLFRARRKLTEEYDELASGRRCEQVQSVIETGRARTVRSFGIRERRQLTRHLAHCQPCRRSARLAGVDASLIQPRGIAAKIAAVLPIPIWRWPWLGRGSGSVHGGTHQLTAVQSLPSAAAAPAGSSITLGQAAAAAAALAIAGAGGGVVSGLVGAKHSSDRPALVRSVDRLTARGPVLTLPPVAAAVPSPLTRSPGALVAASPNQPSAAKIARLVTRFSQVPAARSSAPAPPHSTGSAGFTPAPRPATAPSTRTATGVASGTRQTVSGAVPGVTQTVTGVVDGTTQTATGARHRVAHTVTVIVRETSPTTAGASRAASAVSPPFRLSGSTTGAGHPATRRTPRFVTGGIPQR